MVLSLLLMMAPSVWGGGGSQAVEVRTTVSKLLSGEMSLNVGVSRLKFLGAGPWVTEQLVEALKEEANPRRRLMLVELLAALGAAGASAEAAYVTALHDDGLSMRLAGLRGLGQLRATHAGPMLLEHLHDPLVGIRREAARSLAKLKVAGAGRALVQSAQREQDLETRLVMVQSLGALGDARLAKHLEPWLASDSEATRLVAARSLCVLGSPKGVAYARQLLAAPEPDRRLQGVLLFEGAPAKSARRWLTPALDDGDAKVRANAARVLVVGGDAALADWLVLESYKASGDARPKYEAEIEKLRLTDEQRSGVLKRAGLQ